MYESGATKGRPYWRQLRRRAKATAPVTRMFESVPPLAPSLIVTCWAARRSISPRSRTCHRCRSAPARVLRRARFVSTTSTSTCDMRAVAETDAAALPGIADAGTDEEPLGFALVRNGSRTDDPLPSRNVRCSLREQIFGLLPRSAKGLNRSRGRALRQSRHERSTVTGRGVLS